MTDIMYYQQRTIQLNTNRDVNIDTTQNNNMIYQAMMSQLPLESSSSIVLLSVDSLIASFFLTFKLRPVRNRKEQFKLSVLNSPMTAPIHR